MEWDLPHYIRSVGDNIRHDISVVCGGWANEFICCHEEMDGQIVRGRDWDFEREKIDDLESWWRDCGSLWKFARIKSQFPQHHNSEFEPNIGRDRM